MWQASPSCAAGSLSTTWSQRDNVSAAATMEEESCARTYAPSHQSQSRARGTRRLAGAKTTPLLSGQHSIVRFYIGSRAAGHSSSPARFQVVHVSSRPVQRKRDNDIMEDAHLGWRPQRLLSTSQEPRTVHSGPDVKKLYTVAASDTEEGLLLSIIPLYNWLQLQNGEFPGAIVQNSQEMLLLLRELCWKQGS